MAWQQIVMWIVVVGIGFPAAFHCRWFLKVRIRNVTALALVVAWLAGEIVSLMTGNSLPTAFYWKIDCAVIFLIFAKTISRVGAKLYPTAREKLCGLVLEHTVYDRWIVAIFVVGQWPLYVLNIGGHYKWLLLAGLSIAQFLLAGAESLADFLKARREAEKPSPIIDRHLVVVPFRRHAEAVKKTPEPSGSLLAACRGGDYG